MGVTFIEDGLYIEGFKEYGAQHRTSYHVKL